MGARSVGQWGGAGWGEWAQDLEIECPLCVPLSPHGPAMIYVQSICFSTSMSIAFLLLEPQIPNSNPFLLQVKMVLKAKIPAILVSSPVCLGLPMYTSSQALFDFLLLICLLSISFFFLFSFMYIYIFSYCTAWLPSYAYIYTFFFCTLHVPS